MALINTLRLICMLYMNCWFCVRLTGHIPNSSGPIKNTGWLLWCTEVDELQNEWTLPSVSRVSSTDVAFAITSRGGTAAADTNTHVIHTRHTSYIMTVFCWNITSLTLTPASSPVPQVLTTLRGINNNTHESDFILWRKSLTHGTFTVKSLYLCLNEVCIKLVNTAGLPTRLQGHTPPGTQKDYWKRNLCMCIN